MITKNFPIGEVLTVATGRLMCNISDLFSILEWMTNDRPYLHQIPRFLDECRPYLIRWFPELETSCSPANMMRFDTLINDDKACKEEPCRAVKLWLAWMMENCACKASYNVPRIPQDDHTIKDPFEEYKEIRGSDDDLIVLDS